MPRPIVVIGDTMLDIDIEGSASRLSPEAPVPVVDTDRIWHRPGGAGLAAVLAARTHSDVALVTAVADDTDGHTLAELLHEAGVDVVALAMNGSTLCKTRIRARGQSMLRLDHGDGSATADALNQSALDALDAAGAVCVADYGHGVTAHPQIRARLTRLCADVPVVWDPHPRGAPPIPGCWLVTPNQDEAREASAASLRRDWGARAVSVTMGSRGALLATEDGSVHIPAQGVPAEGDPCGAGDRFAVAATQALADGADVGSAVATAVGAATDFVAAGGAVAVSRPAPIGARGRLAASGGVEALRRRGGRLVATGGCFDLLHTGHVRLLHQARQLGDALVVLVNSDDSVRALKGPRRPVMPAQDRARVLSALECVDEVIIFDEGSPAAVLDRLRPDVWVKGGDYTEADLPEAEVVRRHGGEVVLLPTVAGYSSTKLIAAAVMTGARRSQP
ncbi:PfkB family carbohydrate kinase [Mycolicibacterium sp. 120270]|uniref:PfkB family carbohydrate kinase n=1 Tax=Mycolicibacterium sp. 120270 TaxID=3090600 RepID=UPI00299EAA49|nr:PfkB family carbohydrate kinase [Mycolicibacterium sp. 120270]MDX1884115.1 PfkB family carbohydrate kinase [Mycolicibacterium sp. 120270]